MKRFLAVVRIVWISAGLLFLAWQFNSYRAQGVDFAALRTNPEIQISEEGPAIEVMPINSSQPVGLIFYPGGMVEPRAYLPMAYHLAEAGYPVRIVKLPWRSARPLRRAGAAESPGSAGRAALSRRHRLGSGDHRRPPSHDRVRLDLDRGGETDVQFLELLFQHL